MPASSTDSLPARLPEHIAIIMDGNGRWAKQRKLPRTAGHTKGVSATRNTIEYCVDHGIRYLTLFAFSSENWNRPAIEVNSLMKLFMSSLKSNLKSMHANGVRIRFIGDRSAFSKSLQQAIAEAEALTRENAKLGLNIAANYGGHWDILQASKSMLLQAEHEGRDIGDLTEADLQQHICLADIPAPDLFIRTGGEQRISNYLLWQLAYTELYFCDLYWPDFDAAAMQGALNAFAARQRRFGLTGDQVSGNA